MERVVQCVRGDFFRGQTFPDLADAQRRVEQRCRSTAGLRVHVTTAQRPAEHFATDGKALLLTLPVEGAQKASRRSRGTVRKHRAGYQVRVSAGTDPVTGERLRLQGTAPTMREAEKLRTKLLGEADTFRRPGQTPLSATCWIGGCHSTTSTRTPERATRA